MKKILLLTLILFSSLCFGRDIEAPHVDENIIFTTNVSGTMTEQSRISNNGDIVHGGITELQNNRLLKNSTDDFPSVSNINGWHLNGTSSWDGSSYFGGTGLTQVGTWTTGTDRFGNTVYNTISGTQCAYINDYHTANEAFSAWGIFKLSALTNGQILLSKLDGTNANNSFYVQLVNGGTGTNQRYLEYKVYTNSSGAYRAVRDYTEEIAQFNDNYYFIGISYSPTDQSILLMVNDRIAGFDRDSTLSNRNNNSNTTFDIGAYDCAGTPSNYTTGKVEEFGYSRYSMTPDQFRKLYVRTFSEKGYVSNSKTYVNGKRRALYYYYPSSSITVTATAAGTSLTGYSMHIAENDTWNINANMEVSMSDAAGTSSYSESYALLKRGSEDLQLYNIAFYFQVTSGTLYAQAINFPFTVNRKIFANKLDKIWFEAWKYSGTTTLVFSSGRKPFIMLSKDM